jgi:hypothetical protein
MRKPIALSATQKDVAAVAKASLPAPDEFVKVYFRKQNGTFRSLSGRLAEVKGSGDKAVVVVETANGYRSANLHRVISVKAL